MSALRPLVLGIVVWAVLSNGVRAEPITLPTNLDWVAYFAGQNGNAAAPAAVFPFMFVPSSTSQPQSQEPATTTSESVFTNAPVTQPQSATTTSVSVLANAPVMQPQSATPSTPSPATSAGSVDAFINLGNGPYPSAKYHHDRQCPALVQ